MIEFFWLVVVFILFYVSVAMLGADTRDGEDWSRHQLVQAHQAPTGPGTDQAPTGPGTDQVRTGPGTHQVRTGPGTPGEDRSRHTR